MQKLQVYRDPKEGPCYREFYEKSEADKVISCLEEKVEELTGELRIARPTFKCAECGEAGLHKWVWNGKEGADFVARRCCDKCIKEKGLTLWPRVHSCEEKCKEFNALKVENAALKENHRKEVERLQMKIAGLEKLVETADKVIKQKGGFTIKDVKFGGVKLREE